MIILMIILIILTIILIAILKLNDIDNTDDSCVMLYHSSVCYMICHYSTV